MALPLVLFFQAGILQLRDSKGEFWSVSIRDVLVHMDASDASAVRLASAIALAKAHGAQVSGLFIRSLPNVPQWMVAPLGPDVVEVQAEFARQASAKAEVTFKNAITEAGIEADWRSAEGDEAGILIEAGRLSDLVVMGRTGVEKRLDLEKRFIAHVILEVARPVLVVPAAQSNQAVGKNILIAWDGSREAVRAVNDAMPLLNSAEKVSVVAVGGTSSDEEGKCALPSICAYLKRHGVEVCECEVKADDRKAGPVLLKEVETFGADMIVMGAYGRSRLRDIVLGGTTRHLLRHAKVPLLMSH